MGAAGAAPTRVWNRERRSVVLLAGRWLDLYLMIMPPFSSGKPRIGIWEIGLVAGLVGAFGGLVYAGWSSLSGRTEQIKYGLMGSALCGLAWAIVNAMFTAGGQDANIQLQQPN